MKIYLITVLVFFLIFTIITKDQEKEDQTGDKVKDVGGVWSGRFITALIWPVTLLAAIIMVVISSVKK